MTPPTCAQTRELAPELALGLLTGAERAAALAHLEGCAACRTEVASLTDVGEAVLALAPEVEPSAGFESRVLDRIAAARSAEPARPAEPPRPAGPPRPARRRWAVRGAMAGLAAAVLAVVVAVGVAVVGRDGGDGGGAEVAAELRTAAGRVVGQATVGGADPTTVTVEMDGWVDELRTYGDRGDRTWWLRVATRDGGEEAYALPLDETGPWHVPLGGAGDDGGGSEVASVAVVDETGRTWCSASFASGAGEG